MAVRGERGPGPIAYGLIGGLLGVGAFAAVMILSAMSNSDFGEITGSVGRAAPKQDRAAVAGRPATTANADHGTATASGL